MKVAKYYIFGGIYCQAFFKSRLRYCLSGVNISLSLLGENVHSIFLVFLSILKMDVLILESKSALEDLAGMTLR
jgi:hypothetical protein